MRARPGTPRWACVPLRRCRALRSAWLEPSTHSDEGLGAPWRTRCRRASEAGEVFGETRLGLFEVRDERLARDLLDGFDVAEDGLDLHVVRNRRDRTVAAEALLDEPAPHVLFVEALRIAAGGEALLVA